MCRILESKLEIKFEDNKERKASIIHTARTTAVELFSNHYKYWELYNLRVYCAWQKIKKWNRN